MKPIEERGYIIPAFNAGSVDYVNCARALAKTLLQHHPHARICLLTNEQHAADQHLFAYTHVVQDIDTVNPYANDWLVFYQTPFRQTIKLEADMEVASAVDHWWTLFEHKDVVISTGARDWLDRPVTTRFYRKTFDSNHLPDVYNAITYWRLSQTAQEFFTLVRTIFDHWDQWRTLLKFADQEPTTDVVYAMAAQVMGPERVTLPSAFGPTIVHMKRYAISSQTEDWTKELIWERTDGELSIQTRRQWGLFHYHVKGW